MNILNLQDFFPNPHSFPDRQSCEEALDGELRQASLAWSRLTGILPIIMGGMDEQFDESSRCSEKFLFWVVDLSRGIKLMADHARCFYTDERGDEPVHIDYGDRIEYTDPHFVDTLIHLLTHATEAAAGSGAITCPECGSTIAAASLVER